MLNQNKLKHVCNLFKKKYLKKIIIFKRFAYVAKNTFG